MTKVPVNKIKTIGSDVKFIRGLDLFNIIEPNSWLIIDDLANPLKNGLGRMLQ